MFNKSCTVVLKDMTSKEAWSDVKPNVDYFKFFGCIGHVHLSDSKTKKLDDKSFPCVVLGTSEESKAYNSMMECP